MSETFPIPFGRYQLTERLAIGGMAELFLARSTHPEGPKVPVVIKRLLPHMTHDPHFNAMFIDEAKLTARLAHPNIVSTLEFNRHDDWLYMVMEYVDGLDGLAMLRECARRKVRLPTEITVYIVHEILHALDFAHNQVDEDGQPLNVVHRDISPSNVLVSRTGEVKLVDFGIARATQREHNTKDGTLKGKYGYMSPEQVIDEELDGRSDLFSVGIVLAELLTGRRLFAAPNELDVLLMVRDARLDRLDKYGGHIGLDLDRILRKALSKQPDDRFGSAAEFRDVLGDWLYLHNHEIRATTIATIVDSLYQEAWKRKREQLAQANAARAAIISGVAASAPAGSRATARPAVADGASGDVQFVDLEPSEALYSVEHIDGIPAGHPMTTDSILEISVEVEGRIEHDGALDAVPVLEDGVVEPVSDEPYTVDVNDLIVDDDLGGDAVPVPLDDLISGPMGAVDHGDAGAVPATEIVAEESSAYDFDDSEISMVDGPRAMAGGRAATADPAADAVLSEAELGPADDVGNFAESPPVAVLYRLASARATGLLIAERDEIRKEIYFHQGIPEFVSSNVPSELFGAYLIDQGVLNQDQLDQALAEMPRYSGKLGDTLIALGLLKPLQVFRLLTRQVRHKLVDVCTWSAGGFRWYGGRDNPREAFPLDLNAFEIIGAGAMQLSDEVVDAWLSTLSPGCQPRTLPSSRFDPSMFQLGMIMDDVYRRLDGFHYLAELREHFQEIGAYPRFVRILYLLVQTGLAAPA